MPNTSKGCSSTRGAQVLVGGLKVPKRAQAERWGAERERETPKLTPKFARRQRESCARVCFT